MSLKGIVCLACFLSLVFCLHRIKTKSFATFALFCLQQTKGKLHLFQGVKFSLEGIAIGTCRRGRSPNKIADCRRLL